MGLFRYVQHAIDLTKPVRAQVLAADDPRRPSWGYSVFWTWDGREESYGFSLPLLAAKATENYLPDALWHAWKSDRLIILNALQSGTFKTGIGADLFPREPERKPRTVWDYLNEDAEDL